MSTYEQEIEDPSESLPSRWRAYPEYKESEIEWFGELPSHWQAIVLKFLAGNSHSVVQTGPFGAQLHSSDYVDEGIPLILIRNIGDNFIDDSEIPRITNEDAERLKNYQLNVGDIIFSRVGSIGRLALITEREKGWVISGQCLRLRINNPKLHDNFLVRALGSEPVLTYVDLKSVGSTRESINTDILRNMPIPLPPLEEQRIIAAFLDRETNEIDALIGKKEALIELLQEQRSAIINHAVTKGLNPKAPMKDSGIEWLGEIPTHWNKSKLKYLVKFVGGGTPTKDNLAYWGGDIPWVSPKDMKIDVISSAEDTITELGLIESSSSLVDIGSVLIVVRSGILKHTLPVAINSVPVALNQDMKALLTNGKLSPTYLAYLLKGSQKDILVLTHKIGATVDSIETDLISNMYFPIPPIAEQVEIVDCLEREVSEIDMLIGKTQETIEKLQEYRTVLISAAVTGKIDVRGEV